MGSIFILFCIQNHVIMNSVMKMFVYLKISLTMLKMDPALLQNFFYYIQINKISKNISEI